MRTLLVHPSTIIFCGLAGCCNDAHLMLWLQHAVKTSHLEFGSHTAREEDGSQKVAAASSFATSLPASLGASR